MCTPSNICFFGPTRVHNPNDISIGSATFAQLTAVSGHVISLKNCPLAWGDLDPI